MKLLVYDNYDSFTYNLVHIIEEHGIEHDVYRNDKLSLDEIGQYDKILLSPGPGIPIEAGNMLEVIKEYAPKKSILGVCLGHQGIAEVFGGELINMEKVLHGVSTKVSISDTQDYLFKDIVQEFEGGHYHSWVVDDVNFPEELEVTAINENGLIMALKHKEFDVRGVQFHPESVLTEHGKEIIMNWLNN
ncbi:MAG: aminodeoxychorismate/anthranilate synthase component II [Bacteroidetes bacterium]|nr:aminodeoxychorismate/anthranilate synthase component II [Bacteroidia bacterium]PCH65062.1 MAG: aminodeoxychorismate/anthranilate synthase component II [Bacteroidota bacterium]